MLIGENAAPPQEGADERIRRLEGELARADRIIRALIERVETVTDFRATDSDGTNYRDKGFAVFETAVAWDVRVRARTADQFRALNDLAGALAQKSALLQATLDTIHAGVCVYDAERRLTAWNASFLSIARLGGQGVEAVATHDALVAACLGARAARAASPLSWLSPDAPAEVALWAPEPGTTIEVRRALMPDGGMAMSFDDVSYRVRAAAALQELNESLELRVHERTADLEAVNAQLQREVGERVAAEAALLDAKLLAEQLNIDKTRFLAAVSHDLVQPLNAARLFVTALGNHDIPSLSRPLVRQAGSALDSVEEILEALLEISQLDAGAIRPALEDVDLDQLLQSMMTEFAPFASQRGLTLAMESAGCWARSDHRLLRRILQNLISNALRYTERGEVRIKATRQREQIFVEVSDTGPGIARKDRDLIFKEFSRLSGSKQAGGGVGLGLAIVDRAARMLQHPLTLRSRLGVGSTFRLTLPAGRARTESDLAKADPFTAPLRGRQILVIDNEETSLTGLTALLTTWGCAVEAVRDGREASAAVEQRGVRPDVVIADYHLDDGVTGDAVLARLSAILKQPLRSIIVTADREPVLRKRLTEQGFHVLDKPVKPVRLRAVMQYLVTIAEGAAAP
jgi:signal transduction histidine kinase